MNDEEKVLIFFQDCHNDGCDKVVEATESEWKKLIAPALERRNPVDGSTVDPELLDELMERSELDLKMSEIKKIERVVPMV